MDSRFEAGAGLGPRAIYSGATMCPPANAPDKFHLAFKEGTAWTTISAGT